VILCIQSAITCLDSNFKFWKTRGRLHISMFSLIRSIHRRMHKILSHNAQNYEFFFSKIYSQWILNCVKKYQEFIGENRFLIGCFVEKLSWKNGRDYSGRTHADMCEHVSATVRCNVQIAERFLCGNELVLIHATIRFYALSRKKPFCAAWPRILCVRSVGSASNSPAG
jgi:hypothetical protein